MGQTQSAISSDCVNLNNYQAEEKTECIKKDVSTKLSQIEKEASSSVRKKFIRLGTIRRKLAKSLRNTKNSDYRKQIGDLLQTWSVHDIKLLVKQYEGLEALKQISKLSADARPKCLCIEDHFGRTFEQGTYSDVTIEYKNEIFKLHKAILLARCAFFRDLFTKANLNEKGNIEIKLDDAIRLSVPMVNSLFRLIYTGQIKDAELKKNLAVFSKHFGKLNDLKHDMKLLLNNDKHCDIKLVFEYPKDQVNLGAHAYVDNDGSVDNTLEVSCHSYVLCTRSTFFSSLLSMYNHNQDPNSNEPLRLVLCEKIIPRCYIKAILHCFYTDVVDLSSVIKWKVADDGSGEADRLLTTVELAMELYEVGNFLEFHMLVAGCENIIIGHFDVSSLLGVLEWSSQPFGSDYVHRQALQYFAEEFCTVCKVPVFLANVPKNFFLEVIKSDFLQAQEEYILAVIIKWGEWQVMKANERPGSSPGNSLPRRSPKRKDIDNKLLRETISELLPYVRLKHILPSNSSVLNSAYQRRLLQRPYPVDVVASEKHVPSVSFWLHECRHKEYERPRLFMPYVYEVKLALHERLSDNDHPTSPSTHTVLPDMLPLYHMKLETPSQCHEEVQDSFSILDIINLEQDTFRDMILREKELKDSEETVKALSLAPDAAEISSEIQLRVVREFGLPDEVASKIFQQTPDLIEDSGSSSNSSKQSTLSKVGRLLKYEKIQALDQACSIDLLPRNSPDDLVSRTCSILNKTAGACASTTENLPSHTFDDSPLDLPVIENVTSLPNVLLDT